MTVLLASRGKSPTEDFAPTVDEVDVFYHTVQGDAYRHGDWWGNDTAGDQP